MQMPFFLADVQANLGEYDMLLHNNNLQIISYTEHTVNNSSLIAIEPIWYPLQYTTGLCRAKGRLCILVVETSQQAVQHKQMFSSDKDNLLVIDRVHPEYSFYK